VLGYFWKNTKVNKIEKKKNLGSIEHTSSYETAPNGLTNDAVFTNGLCTEINTNYVLLFCCIEI